MSDKVVRPLMRGEGTRLLENAMSLNESEKYLRLLENTSVFSSCGVNSRRLFQVLRNQREDTEKVYELRCGLCSFAAETVYASVFVLSVARYS